MLNYFNTTATTNVTFFDKTSIFGKSFGVWAITKRRQPSLLSSFFSSSFCKKKDATSKITTEIVTRVFVTAAAERRNPRQNCLYMPEFNCKILQHAKSELGPPDAISPNCNIFPPKEPFRLGTKIVSESVGMNESKSLSSPSKVWVPIFRRLYANNKRRRLQR